MDSEQELTDQYTVLQTELRELQVEQKRLEQVKHEIEEKRRVAKQSVEFLAKELRTTGKRHLVAPALKGAEYDLEMIEMDFTRVKIQLFRVHTRAVYLDQQLKSVTHKLKSRPVAHR